MNKYHWPIITDRYRSKKVIQPEELTNPLDWILQVPNKGGIYFLWGNNGLEYIGVAAHFRSRLKCHQVFTLGYHTIGLIFIANAAERLSFEAEMIRILLPPKNKVIPYPI